MPYDEIDHVGNIKAGDIIKWADDKWLDDPNVDSKAKIWLCVGVKSGKGAGSTESIPSPAGGTGRNFQFVSAKATMMDFFEPRLSY